MIFAEIKWVIIVAHDGLEMKIYCATSNQGKLAEFRRAADKAAMDKLEILPLPDLSSITPCEETGKTIAENAVLKAVYYGSRFDGLLFAEDSGLEVEALNGEPGVYSARWGGEGTDDAINNQLLLRCLQDFADRSARFVCVIALVRSGHLLESFRGEAQGQILQEPRGAYGFGYDPLFYYPPLQRSFAELSSDEKLDASHRGRAIEVMFRYLKDLKNP